MIVKSCTLIACFGGLVYAQAARADGTPPDNTQCGSCDVNPPDGTPPPATTTTTTTTTTAPAPEPQPQPPEPVYTEQYQGAEMGMGSHLATGIGVGLSVGGGISGFTDRSMRDTAASSVSGLWNAHATFGTHIPIGIDVGYAGTAVDVNTFNGLANGTLIGTTLEGALRWNMLPHYFVNPYILAGLGWQRYDLRDVQFATADTGMKTSDNSLEVPMALGLSMRDPSGFMFDLRGTFRVVSSSDLLVDPRNGQQADLHTWAASGALGYEF